MEIDESLNLLNISNMSHITAKISDSMVVDSSEESYLDTEDKFNYSYNMKTRQFESFNYDNKENYSNPAEKTIVLTPRKSLLKKHDAVKSVVGLYSTPMLLGKPKKEVSFGKKLTPELFDKTLPPNTPLQKGRRPETLTRESMIIHSESEYGSVIDESLDDKNNISNLNLVDYSTSLNDSSSKEVEVNKVSESHPITPLNLVNYDMTVLDSTSKITEAENKVHDELENGITPKTTQIESPHFTLKDNTTISIDNNNINENAPENSTFNMENNNAVSNASNNSKVQKSLASKIPKPGSLCTTPYYERIRDKKSKTDKTTLVCYSVGSNKVESLRKSSRIPKTPLTVLKTTRHAKMPSLVLDNKNNSKSFTWQNSLMCKESTPNEKAENDGIILEPTTMEKTAIITPSSNHLLPWPKSIGKMQHFKTTGKCCVANNDKNIDNYTPESENVKEQQSENLSNDKLGNTAFLDGKNNEYPKDIIDFSPNKSLKCDVDDSIKQTDKTMDSLSNTENSMGLNNSSNNKDLTSVEKTPRRSSTRISCKTQPSTPAISITSNKTINETPITNKTYSPNNSINSELIKNSVLDKDTSSISNFSEKTDPHLLGKDIRIIVTSCTPHIENENENINITIEKPKNVSNPPTLEEISTGMDQSILNVSDGNISNVQHNTPLNNTKGQNNEKIKENDTIENVLTLNNTSNNNINPGNNMDDDFETKPQKTMGEKKYTKAELAEINRKINYVNHWVIAFSHYNLAKNKILASCKNKNRKNHLQRKSKIKAKTSTLNTSTMRSAKRSLKRTLRNVNKKSGKTILINARNTKKIKTLSNGKIKPIRNIISKQNTVPERNSFLREEKRATTHKMNDHAGVSPKLNASIKQKTMDEKNSISLHNSINPKSMKSAKIIKPSNAKVLKERQPLYKLLKHGGRNEKNLPPKPILLSSTRKCARKLVKRIATTNTTAKKPKHTIFLSSLKNSKTGGKEPEMMNNNSKNENRRSTRLSSIRIEKNDLLLDTAKGIASPIRLEKSNILPSNDNVLSNGIFSNEKATLELFGTPKTYQKGLKMARNSTLISSLRSTLVNSSSTSLDLNSKTLRTKSDIYVQKGKNQTLPYTGEDHKKFRSTFHHNIPPMLMNDETTLSIPHPVVPPQIENVDMVPPQKLMNSNNIITLFENSPVIQQNDMLSENVTNNPNNDDEIEQFRHSQDCTDPAFNYAKSNHSNNTYRVSDPLFTETTFVKERTDSLEKSFSSPLSSTNTQTRSYSLYEKQPFKSSENAPNKTKTRVSLQSGPPPHQPNTPITSSKNSVQLHGKRVETRRIPGLNKLFNTNLGNCNFNDDTKHCNYNAGDSSESSLFDNCQLKSTKAGKKFTHLTADLFESSTFKKSSRGSACLALMEARRMKNAAATGLESAKNHIANGKRKNRSTPPQILNDGNKDQNSPESSKLINENGQNLTYVIAGEPRTEALKLENDDELFNEVTGKNIVTSKVKSPYNGKKALKASDLNAISPGSIRKNSMINRKNSMINNSESEMKSQTADTDASPKAETLKKRATKRGGSKSKTNRKPTNKKNKTLSKTIAGKKENEAVNSDKIPARNIIVPLENDMVNVAKEIQNKSPPAKIKSTKRSTRNHPNKKSISDNTEQPADILEEKTLEVPLIVSGKRVGKSRNVKGVAKSDTPISNTLVETNNQNVQMSIVSALIKSRSRSKSNHSKMIKPQQEKQENIMSATINNAVIMPTSPKQPPPLIRSKRKAKTVQKNEAVNPGVLEITSETQKGENVANIKSKRGVKQPTKTEEAPIINVPDIIEPPKPKRTRQIKQPKLMGDTEIEQSNLTEMINQSGKPKNAIEEIPISANKKRRNKRVAFDLDNIQQLIISRANSIEPTTCLTAISIPKRTPKKANNKNALKRVKQSNNRESETIPASINGEESSKVVENLSTNVEMGTRKRKSIPTAKMLNNEFLSTIQPDTQVSENIKPISNKKSKMNKVEVENNTRPLQIKAPPLKSVKTAKNVTLKTTKSSTDSRKPQRCGPVKKKTDTLPKSKVVIEETQSICKRVTRSQKRI